MLGFNIIIVNGIKYNMGKVGGKSMNVVLMEKL